MSEAVSDSVTMLIGGFKRGMLPPPEQFEERPSGASGIYTRKPFSGRGSAPVLACSAPLDP